MASDLEKFLEERSKIPIRGGQVARVELLAKELAMGYDRDLWDNIGTWVGSGAPHPYNENVSTYFQVRWSFWTFQDSVDRLQSRGYSASDGLHEELTNVAIALIDEPEDVQPKDSSDSYDGFISYKRSENSSLALLARTTLQLHEFTPFIDLELNPTDDWHARLEQRVRSSSYVVALIGPNTLASKFVVREIHWAIQHSIPILQIRNYGFQLVASEWQDIEFPHVSRELQNQQAIEIIAESAEGLQLAMDRLLQAVGVTP